MRLGQSIIRSFRENKQDSEKWKSFISHPPPPTPSATISSAQDLRVRSPQRHFIGLRETNKQPREEKKLFSFFYHEPTFLSSAKRESRVKQLLLNFEKIKKPGSRQKWGKKNHPIAQWKKKKKKFKCRDSVIGQRIRRTFTVPELFVCFDPPWHHFEPVSTGI